MARISLDPPRTLLNRVGEWYSRRAYGAVLDPGRALGHHRRVLIAYTRLNLAAQRWSRLDHATKDLAVFAASAQVGCSWCLDFGYWEAHLHGVPARKITEINRWRDSDVYTPRERAVIGYAEAMSATPPEVTDEMAAELREHFDEARIVELTMMIAVENLRSRVNAAFGLTSQGFRDRCELPSGRGG